MRMSLGLGSGSRAGSGTRAGLGLGLALALLPACSGRPPSTRFVSGQVTANPTGAARTVSLTGASDDNAFFHSLGTNGRACVTCHQPADGWTLTPPHLRQLFDESDGLDPVFRTNDGSNSPNGDVSTVAARRKAYSMLLSRGTIRVGIGVPESAEFSLLGVEDPYGFASAKELSLFRRPVPSTNLMFASSVMWDDRETFPGRSIHFDLTDQANGATLGHAAATAPLSDSLREEIVGFEASLITAQAEDGAAGELDGAGSEGGAEYLGRQEFYLGINAFTHPDPTGAPFRAQAFDLYDAWLEGAEPRAAIARGQAIFNSRTFTARSVRGLNDLLGKETITATCTTCHGAPNVGSYGLPVPFDIGISDGSRRAADLPLYTFRDNRSGEQLTTSDPGRALITGKWADMNRYATPILRGLAARPPYFHDGSAASLAEVVDFYDTRFDMGLSTQEAADLAAFLGAL